MNLQKGEGQLPGHDLVTQGLSDLANGIISESSLLVLVASPRLRRLGIEVPERALSEPYEHALYALIEERLGTGAYSYYNSLLRRMDSYAHALEREQSPSAVKSKWNRLNPFASRLTKGMLDKMIHEE